VLVLFVIDVIITLIFRASVEAQSGAYATGVLVLILSAAFAATLALWRERRWGLAFYMGIVCLVFAYTLVDNCLERPDGLIIGIVFTLLLMLTCAVSRSIRSVEFRIPHGYFTDVESSRIGPELRGKRVHLVPIPSSSPEARRKKRAEIARHYGVRGPLLFLHVNLLDNRSEFSSPLEVTLKKEDDDYVAEVFGAVAIANTIAYISEAIDPISIFIGLTRRDLMAQALRYLLFGEGETGLIVYTILLRYWDWTAEEDVRPLIFLMSD
jgi:Ca2+/Na+ antiporter